MWSFFAILVFIVLVALLLVAFVFKGNSSTDRLYMVYYEDGLWDLYLGMILLALGITEWIEASWISIVPAILYLFLLAAKRSITAPRLRPEDLPPAQATQRRTVAFIMLGLAFGFGLLVFVLMAVGSATWFSAWLDLYLAPGVLLAVIAFFALWVYRNHVPRLLGYASLFLAALLSGFWFALPLYVYALVIGAIIGASGLAVTMRFVDEHPKLANR